MAQVKTVLLTELKSALSTKLKVELRPVLCYVISLLFLFFMSATSLWSWATRPGCSSRVIAFFFLCHLTMNMHALTFLTDP